MQYACVVCLGDDLRPTVKLLLSSYGSREFITLCYKYSHEKCGYIGLNPAVWAKKSAIEVHFFLFILNSQNVRLIKSARSREKKVLN